MISMLMLKLCEDSIWKPLKIIFKNCLKECIFPDELVLGIRAKILENLKQIGIKLNLVWLEA